MKSPLPKVLHPIAGVPMVCHAIEAALGAGADQAVVVVGYGREQVQSVVSERFGSRVRFAVQPAQRGTADAVRAGLGEVPDDAARVLITYGDAPCVPADALRALLEERARLGAALALITCDIARPAGYGRIVRDAHGRVVAIREDRDCSDAERVIQTINPGLYAADRAFLGDAIGGIGRANAQGEFYLTDMVALATRSGTVGEVRWDAEPLRGINDRAELCDAEVLMWKSIADRHRRGGVTIALGAMIDRDVQIAPDAWIGPNVCLRGRTRVGAGARIDAGCVIDDASIGDGAVVKPYSVLARSEVGRAAQIGPFAHVRPDSVIGDEAHVGNFVELKKTRMGTGAKANHLAYLGDGEVGSKANIGAGTIFCNYDGYRKHVTAIGAGAFVGSNSALVAPITIGEGAYIGSGSVITQDVPAGALGVGRARQVNKDGYAEKIRAFRTGKP
jgi:bifunctional UDP-N-acetylglucosamine pyrophosphorylase/glucosamine-1-phosphate N-acetyltransferase